MIMNALAGLVSIVSILSYFFGIFANSHYDFYKRLDPDGIYLEGLFSGVMGDLSIAVSYLNTARDHLSLNGGLLPQER